ncbi:radical SAM protein [Hippea alviniae]|uniref:radical SAM protein n=1 Tax=Hippea alviniae TaxID=1279027 RepID=UPI0003B57F6A|nr:radical SAM protein [Hippea alviniae]
MEFLFGPVPSRRLGLSLGVNIIPYKTCTYNCVYCEAGKTTKLTVKRESFFEPADIEREFTENVDKMGRIDVVTFSGGGEPTLNKDLGRFIRFVKDKGFKVAVLTNGSLMFMEDVREDLMSADVVIPSLDAVLESSFIKVNRPHGSLKIERIIDGLVDFCKDFKGEVWLEVLLVRSLNDSKDDLKALSDAIERIKPSKVQVGTVDRPPAESWVEKLSDKEMMDVYVYLSAHTSVEVELIGGFNKENDAFKDDVERAILKLINIRPCSKDELKSIFSLDESRLNEILEKFEKEGRVYRYTYGNKQFIAGNVSLVK